MYRQLIALNVAEKPSVAKGVSNILSKHQCRTVHTQHNTPNLDSIRFKIQPSLRIRPTNK